MTEPEVAGLGPDDAAHDGAVRDGDEYVINGHKWFSTNGSIADFLIVMAVTDPDARPHQRASMIIVPADTPGVNIVRDIGTMEHPIEGSFGKLGNHAEIRYEDVRVPGREPARRRGRRLPHRPAPPRPRPHPPLHAVARRLEPRVRHALRALALPRGPRQPAGREADHPELDRRLGGADAGRAADDAARRVEDGHGGRLGRAPGDLAHQVLRRDGDARRRRPRAADPRRARLLDRPAARGDVPLRARRAVLRRAGRGPSRDGRPPDPARLPGAAGRRPDRARARRAARTRAGASRTSSRR